MKISFFGAKKNKISSLYTYRQGQVFSLFFSFIQERFTYRWPMCAWLIDHHPMSKRKNKNSLTLYYTMIIRLKYENNWYLVQCAMTRIEHFGKKWNKELSRPWTTTKKTDATNRSRLMLLNKKRKRREMCDETLSSSCHIRIMVLSVFVFYSLNDLCPSPLPVRKVCV